MNVLIITALYPPAVGGAATYFGAIAPRLARRDEIAHLTVLSERMPGQPRQVTTGRMRLLRRLPTRVSGPRRRWLIHAATYLLTQAWFAARLPGLVHRESIDLIHFHTRYRGRLFYDALRRSGMPVIADLRDKMTDPARLVDVTDRLLCCGEGVRRFAVQGGFPAEHTVLVPIPFEPPPMPSPSQVAATRQRYGLDAGPYLLFLGDITANKGVYDLLAAYRQWQVRHPQVHLVYAGTNRQGARFTDPIERTADAHYLDHVPHQDALALMRGAEVVALPSRSEGLPRVILEAVALGRKVICPPGIPEFERHLPAFTLPQVNAESIRAQLDSLWENDPPISYPLSQHTVSRVRDQLLSTYADTAALRRTISRGARLL